MKATLRDVAREAGLSVAAVSRHLNGQIVLPLQTQSRIETAVKRLQYRPNVLGRRLARGRSDTLGFVTTDVAYSFFASIASAAEAEAHSLGYTLAIFNSRNDLDAEIGFLARLANQEVDGMLFLTNHESSGTLAARMTAAGSVVLIDEDVAGARAGRLFADNVSGGMLAGRHLIKRGHRRIAVVAGPAGMISVFERLEGLWTALDAAGISLDPDMILHGPYAESFGREAFARLMAMPEPPTAIFATGDMLAIGILRAARDSGISIPQDLSLIGFDDMEMVDLLNPPLTTIRQSAETFGREGVRMLVDMIDGGEPDPAPRRVPVELIARGSVSQRGPV